MGCIKSPEAREVKLLLELLEHHEELEDGEGSGQEWKHKEHSSMAVMEWSEQHLGQRGAWNQFGHW